MWMRSYQQGGIFRCIYTSVCVTAGEMKQAYSAVVPGVYNRLEDEYLMKLFGCGVKCWSEGRVLEVPIDGSYLRQSSTPHQNVGCKRET